MNEVVFLGIFDKIANWIMGGITKALTWLFTNVIAPVWSVVWDSFLQYIVDMIREFLAIILYRLYAVVLTIVYALEQMTYSFSGIKSVSLDKQTGNIVDILMNQPAVNKAFWYITAISIVLCFIFTIVAVMRSTFDFNFDSRKSVGIVLTRFFTAAVAFLVMPAFCYGLLQLTTICMNSMYRATYANGINTSLTDNLYMMTVKSAIVSQKPAAVDALARKIADNPMFWYEFDNVRNFLKTLNVKLNARDVDLFLGFVACIALIINLIALSAVFLRRVMELMVLYIVSPFFVATIPLDEGERFNKWRRTFIGRLCMGVAMIIALNIMLVVLGIVMNSDTSSAISFVDIRDPKTDVAGYVSDVALDIIVKLMFMVGCLLSIRSIGVAVTAIMDQDAAQVMSSTPGEMLAQVKQFKSMGDWAKDKLEKEKDKSKKSGGQTWFSKKNGRTTKFKDEASARKFASDYAGFKGETADRNEINFQNKLAHSANTNRNSARKTNRGAERAAYNAAAKKATDMNKAFLNLKTHEERQKFMNDFNRNNGDEALKANTANLKGKGGQKSNSKEDRAAMNLDKKIATAKANRDKFEEGSANWNKYNAQLEKLSDTRDKFDSLGTHAEREAFMDLNKEAFKEREPSSKGEAKALHNLNKRAQNAKAVRDNLTKGTDAWKAADKKYNDLLQKAATIESMDTKAEREAFIDASHDAKDDLGFADRQGGKTTGLRGIQAGIERMFSGSRSDFAGGFKDIRDSIKGGEKQQEAMDALDGRIMHSMAMRDSFEKGSDQWNLHNAKVEAYNAEKLEFSNATPEQRDALIANSNSFKPLEKQTGAESRMASNLDANIANAIEDRDRHAQNSPRWNRANERVNDLNNLRTRYMNAESHDERAAIASENTDAFSNNQNEQYIEMNGKYNAWKMYEANAKTDADREHAHKMAKSYSNFVEDYNRAIGSEERQAVLSSVSQFEEQSSMPSGLEFTAKETTALGEISLSKNEQYISDYMNASTHSQRAEIFERYNSYMDSHSGERPPAYQLKNSDEETYLGYMRETAGRLNTLSASPEYSDEQRGEIRRLANCYTAAADQYEAASTHAERDCVVDVLNSGVSSFSSATRAMTGTDHVRVVEYNDAELNFARGLDGAHFQQFATMTSHSARTEYMDNYHMQSSSFLAMDYDDTNFYSNYLNNGHDLPENLVGFKTRFINATTHEERRRIGEEFNDYIRSGGSYEIDRTWRTTVQSNFVDRVDALNATVGGAEVPTAREIRAEQAPQIVEAVAQQSRENREQERNSGTNQGTTQPSQSNPSARNFRNRNNRN